MVALLGMLGEVGVAGAATVTAGAEGMAGEIARVEAGGAGVFLDDQSDGLRCEGGAEQERQTREQDLKLARE